MMKLIIRFFLFLFCLAGLVFGIKVAALPDVDRPNRILVSNDKIYIIEKTTVTGEKHEKNIFCHFICYFNSIVIGR
jgi:hypothetical protein